MWYVKNNLVFSALPQGTIVGGGNPCLEMKQVWGCFSFSDCLNVGERENDPGSWTPLQT